MVPQHATVSLMGIAILFLTSLGTIILLGSLGVAYSLLHPRRKTYAYALARQLPTDPGALDLPYTETTFHLPHGIEIPAWIIQGRRPDGPTLVHTYGWSDSRYDVLARYAAIWRDLLDQAACIVLYDLRAHGESKATISHLSNAERFDLLAILDELDARAAQPVRYVLWGGSMGANISIVAAAREMSLNPERKRIAAVIADGPYRGPAEPVVRALWNKRYPPYPMVHLGLIMSLPWIGAERGFDRALHAAKLRCPLLVLHGDADAVCRFDSGQAIAAAAPEGEFVAFPGGTHLDLCQDDPQRYRAAMLGLLARL